MDSGKISVIVPIYNSEKHVYRCVNSILNQTYSNIEVILVNDGSTDKSGEICKSLAGKDSRIKVIEKENEGVFSARNVGIKHSTGEFIQFIDSDDYMDKDMCSILFEAINSGNFDVVVCGYKSNKGTGTSCKHCLNREFYDIENFKGTFDYIFENALFNPPWNKLYRKGKMDGIFFKDILVGEDLLFNIDYFSKCSKIVTIADCLYNYSVVPFGSLSSTYHSGLLSAQLHLEEEMRDFYYKNFRVAASPQCIDKVFSKEIYYLLKRLVYAKNVSLRGKYKMIDEIIKKEQVKKVSSKKHISDKQIRMLNFMIRHRFAKSIYLFFCLKKVVLPK